MTRAESNEPSAQTSPLAEPPFDPTGAVSTELGLDERRVRAALQLLEEGNTVPFIARYRKEVTGGLDDAALHAIQERRSYLAELHERRWTILQSIHAQGKLTEPLRRQLLACATKAELEDLYLPYRPKRRTRGRIARERGLEPLAERMLAQERGGAPARIAAEFVNAEREVPDVDSALAGARDIVAERLAETAALRESLRKLLVQRGELCSRAIPEKTREPTKFEQYYDFRESLRTIPSHRYLAVRRGEKEGVLRVEATVDESEALPLLERTVQWDRHSPWAEELGKALRDAWKRLLAPSLETDVRVDLKTRSDREAVDVFADNLRALLLAAPLGEHSVLGIDPGLRTGCKCAVVDSTGRFLGTTTLYPTQDAERAARELRALVEKLRPFAIGVGNGTAGRETEAFVRATLRSMEGKDPIVVSVNEAGASVYSASEVARDEFPDLDVTIRGAISIARRLQDPLAELVKIDPKSIGVGQYQHDVQQTLLGRKLDDVVESCVNGVGVELNTASAPLLARVAGIGPRVARSIVEHRERCGAFRDRAALLEVAGLGPRTFEQCAGFLRLRHGAHPLDRTAVHPERYALVERMAKDLGAELSALVGEKSLASRIDLSRYVGPSVGEPTLRDIVHELERPGRDPRERFEAPQFREDVTEIAHLEVGMELEGVVTNVTHFGAFVDVGVHQDGLVHVSQLADRYVEDPRQVVSVGARLKVRVLEVDLERKRIALSARREAARGTRPGAERDRGTSSPPAGRRAERAQAKSRRARSGPKRGSQGNSGGSAGEPSREGHNNPLGKLLGHLRPESE